VLLLLSFLVPFRHEVIGDAFAAVWWLWVECEDSLIVYLVLTARGILATHSVTLYSIVT
jgi:hypothetical protein